MRSYDMHLSLSVLILEFLGLGEYHLIQKVFTEIIMHHEYDTLWEKMGRAPSF